MTKEARIYNGEKTVSSIGSAGNTGQLYKGMKLEHYLTPYTKISTKQIKDLNVRPETVKLLDENIGGMFRDLGFGNNLIDKTPKA